MVSHMRFALNGSTWLAVHGMAHRREKEFYRMRHTKPITRRPVAAITSLETLLTGIVSLFESLTTIIFQKRSAL
jgi:ribosomal protein L34E